MDIDEIILYGFIALIIIGVLVYISKRKGGILRSIGRPGEEIRILSFGDIFKTFELMRGWTKYARYLDRSTTKEGIELNEAGPIIEKVNGRINGFVYPVDIDTGQGIVFVPPPRNDKKLFEFIEKRKLKFNGDGTFEDDPVHGVEKEFKVEVYPGIPITDKKGTRTVFARILKFDISPEHVKIKTNPKLIGASTGSEIFANALQLKPMRWQIIVTGVVAFLLGYIMKG